MPISCINIPAGSGGVIGTWTAIWQLQHDAEGNHIYGAQISRLGAPLVNELVIGLRDKYKFNSGQPSDDGAQANFVNYVSYPTFPAILSSLFLGTVNSVLKPARP